MLVVSHAIDSERGFARLGHVRFVGQDDLARPEPKRGVHALPERRIAQLLRAGVERLGVRGAG
jgi:hypothetical protein